MSQKLTQDELDEIQGLFKEMNEHKIALADAELGIQAANESKSIIVSRISSTSSNIRQKLEDIEEKYGRVKINISDGTISDPEE
jgi:hypothetical protein